jgi:hypothetical protein
MASVLQITVPVPPAGGSVQLKAGPLFCVRETKVSPEGSVSLSVASEARSGPELARVIVYVMFSPAVAVTGPLFTTDISAEPTMLVVVLLSFSSLGSGVDELTLAVLVSSVPEAVFSGI